MRRYSREHNVSNSCYYSLSDMMMQRPQYDAQGQVPQYNSASYNDGGYSMSRPMDGIPPHAYNQPPVTYYQPPQVYPMGNPMYNVPQGYPPAMPGYRGGRGRGGWYYPNVGSGGYNNMRGGLRGGRGGFPLRRKKPFVGGTLETQREWERQTACCFHLQGSCKFGDGCRFLHEDVEGRACQFGTKCRVHASTKGAEAETPATESAPKKDEKVAETTAEKTEEQMIEKEEEKPSKEAAEKAAETPATESAPKKDEKVAETTAEKTEEQVVEKEEENPSKEASEKAAETPVANDEPKNAEKKE
ncbi:hypothetical protein, conserved [Leishmania tarentolae]|uniref:C3H1-type domain-containing protein n=1 Tax=Leishmania tarentolae TaxID=5689 RepID=A0A640KMQ9_LEITA|nr:hypothetical protein, conserved [Leishmania tarentolae]